MTDRPKTGVITSLVDKLQEFEDHKEVVIDTVKSIMETLDYDSDDRLEVFLKAADHFVDGAIREALLYEATAIKVNYGY